MKRTKTFAATALAALVITGGVVVTAAPANAVISSCVSGNMCAWRDGGYNGPYLNAGSATYNWSGSGLNDIATSLYNYTTKRGVYYKDAGYSGDNIAIGAGGTWGDLWNTLMNDNISSNRRD